MDVCILLGSRSDLPIASKATKVLDDFGVDYELRVASAHRAPKYLEEIIDAALETNCQVFIGMAGVAAALPGVIASMTVKPVIGVPVGGKVPLDSLLSNVQMPRGDNAAVLAVQILASTNPELATAFAAYREAMTNKVIADDELTQSEGA